VFKRRKSKPAEVPKQPHYFVRHGRYNAFTEAITTEGEDDAKRASIDLASRGLGREALILSSSNQRAMESAQIIGRELYSAPFSSALIAQGGERPGGILDLDLFLDKALAETGQELAPNQPLIVVTHAPLITRISRGMPGYGEVVEYIPGTWKNKAH
jgi:broad specificity phosphatase PhoE